MFMGQTPEDSRMVASSSAWYMIEDVIVRKRHVFFQLAIHVRRVTHQ
jgi:hypothetical protein